MFVVKSLCRLGRAGRFAVFVIAAMAALCLSGLQPASAQGAAADWRTIPIVDAHFHLMRFMTPEELLARMDRHNITVTISSGAQGIPQVADPNTRDNAAAAKIGPRYIPAAGSYELLVAERTAGSGFYADPNSPDAATALGRTRDLLAQQPRAIGETFPNTERSHQDPKMRRRVATDGPVFQQLMRLGAQHQRPVLMHMEWHPDSVRQLGSLLEQHPNATVVLAHCGKTSLAADIRPFLQKYKNVHCDLSFRSFPQEEADYKRFPERTIFWPSTPKYPASLQSHWKALIEEMPDRFMAGIDDVHDWAQYDEVVRSIREGLLAQLSPVTMAKVAHENAQRVFRLTP